LRDMSFGSVLGSRSILDGVDNVICAHLGIPANGGYSSRTVCLSLSRTPPQTLDGDGLVAALAQSIEDNWRQSGFQGPLRSREIWRFERMCGVAPKNASRETLFEKKIAELDRSGTWANQIPASSGLMVGSRDKKRNIDLGHRIDARQFEFIELKIIDKTPLHAALQTLMYGMLYLFYKDNFPVKTHNALLLGAEKIELKVVAPEEYYQDCHLRWLEFHLDSGIRKRGAGSNTAMSFSFEAFPGYWAHEEPHILAPSFMSQRRRLYSTGVPPGSL
jgi:hypothetical protein